MHFQLPAGSTAGVAVGGAEPFLSAGALRELNNRQYASVANPVHQFLNKPAL